jgi:toxin ParE1/3/4
LSFGYIVRPRADRDLDEIADYLAGKAGLDTALRFLLEAYETFALLSTQVDMGWPCRVKHPDLKSARQFRVSGSFDKYLIFYQPYKDRIEILRLLHGSQDMETRLSEGGVF